MVTTGMQTKTLEGSKVNSSGACLIVGPPARYVQLLTFVCNIPTDQASCLLIIILRGSIGTSNGVVVEPAHEIDLVGFLDITAIVCRVLVWSDSSWLLGCASLICLFQDVSNWELVTSRQSGEAKGVHQGCIVVAKESVGVQVGFVFLDAIYVSPRFVLSDKANEEFMWGTGIGDKQRLEYEWARRDCHREPVTDAGIAVRTEALQCLIQLGKSGHLILPFKPVLKVCLKGSSTHSGATRAKQRLGLREPYGWHHTARGGHGFGCAYPYLIDASVRRLRNHHLVLRGWRCE